MDRVRVDSSSVTVDVAREGQSGEQYTAKPSQHCLDLLLFSSSQTSVISVMIMISTPMYPPHWLADVGSALDETLPVLSRLVARE